MKLKVLSVIIASSMYPTYLAVGPSRTYTIHEYEQIHGFKSIYHSAVHINRYHITPSSNPYTMYAEAHNLRQHVKNHPYDVIHFYFEDPSVVTLDKVYWYSIFSLAFQVKKKSNLSPYLFTDSCFNILLNDVAEGIFNNTPSAGYSDFLSAL